ncbi:MAG TPA: putative porin [Chryseosolibacter sp.]|nr:putative porin [Chryseosolibacter sp.]
MPGKKKAGEIPHREVETLFLRVRFLNGFCVLILLLVNATGVQAQLQPERRGSRVIDDTTKQIYGPNTSKYYSEQEVFYQRDVLHPIDTAIRNYHRNSTYVQRNDNLYQDLGNIGTAIRPIYYQTPDQIGATSGFHAYDLYWDTEVIRYFDTKSPYTNMQLILGGKGRSLTRAAFSRNINPRWNFGFTYRGLFVDKQIQRKGKNDRITRSNYYDLNTAYQNKDSTYRIFVNFRRMFHRVNEYGGVRLSGEDTVGLVPYFDIDARPWLTTASSEDLRTNFHVFHQFTVGRGLQLYHTLDRYKQKNKFLDVPNEAQAAFFDFTIPSEEDSVKNATTIRTVRNEVGIKGRVSKLFYNGYYAMRHYSLRYNHLPTDTLNVTSPWEKGDESYFGGRMRLALDSLVEVQGAAELMLGGEKTAGAPYRIEGSIRSKWLSASLRQMTYKPSFLAQAYRGRHDHWDYRTADPEGLSNIESSQLDGYLHYRNSVISLSPGVTFTRLRNYVFFDKITNDGSTQHVFPRQSDGNQIFASPEVRASITFFRHVTLSNRTIYTLFIENADDAIRIPDLFVNAQLSYANIFFNGNLDMHAGVDVHWKSAYYALGYDPAIQQYYTQDEFESPAYPLVDLFFSAKIKRARVFFKYNNFLQAFQDTGYMPTPYYPGQRNIFDFGFDWSFYD